MALTTTQRYTLRNNINADPALSAWPNNDDGHLEIVKAYALDSLTDVWRTDAPVQDIINAVDWSRYTPTDSALDTDTAAIAAAKTNRLLAVQTKQMNLQLMLQGRDTLDCSKPSIRTGLRDCVVQVPTGASGAMTNPGGPNGGTVLTACIRKANRGESLFATIQATTGATTAYLLTFEGLVTLEDVREARNLP